MKLIRPAALAVVLLAAATCVPARTVASDSSDVMALINSAVASFNKGDGKAWEALCAPSAPVVSNIAPYIFSSCADWWNANTAYVKKNGVSGERATPETAWHVIVTGDRAYAAIPTDLTYKQKGKTIKSSGILTIALQKTGGGWLMTGWSWAAH